MSSVFGRQPQSGRVSCDGRIASTRSQSTETRKDGAMMWKGNGLVAYFKADEENIILSSGKVSQWSDISGNNKHMTQGTSSRRPTWTASSLNGQPSVSFSGSNVLTRAENIQTASFPFTIGGVFKLNSLTGARGIFAPATSGGSQLTVNVNGTGKREIRSNGIANCDDGAATTNFEVWVGQCRASGAIMKYDLYTSTSQVLQAISPATVAFVNPSGVLSLIGAMTSLAVNGLNGEICELFFVNRYVGPGPINSYLRYVQNKYGVI